MSSFLGRTGQALLSMLHAAREQPRKRTLIRISVACVIAVVLLSADAPTLLHSTVIIAAADSTSQWKSQATVVCDGYADQVEINALLSGGGTVTLAPGTFQIDGYVLPKAGSHLTGQGNSTVINLNGSTVMVADVSGVELDHLKITGASDGDPAASVLIIANRDDISGVSVHDIYNSSRGGVDFLIWAGSSRKVSQVSFVRDTADSPDGNGFMISGHGTSPLVEDVTYYRCTAINSGIASTRLVSSDGTWESGFDLAEYHDMTVNRINVIKCSSYSSWEDGYHFEYVPVKTNIVIIDSYAGNSGVKPDGIYSCGFLLPLKTAIDTAILSGNTGDNNKLGDLRVYDEVTEQYTAYSLPKGVSATWSNISESLYRVKQGNLLGILVDDGELARLVLYSSDGNPVDQWLDLATPYTSDDGQTHTFDGTKVRVRFADYAIVKLVRTDSR